MELEAQLFHQKAQTFEPVPQMMLDVMAPRFRADAPLTKPRQVIRDASPEFIIERRGRQPAENVRMRSNSPFGRDHSPHQQTTKGIYFSEYPTEFRALLQTNGVVHEVDRLEDGRRVRIRITDQRRVREAFNACFDLYNRRGNLFIVNERPFRMARQN
jgi:hypothetical protein